MVLITFTGSAARNDEQALPLSHDVILARCTRSRVLFAWHMAGVCFAVWALPRPAASTPGEVDPAAWGSDHVGKAMPESLTGDECLFCHRVKIGPTWPQNRHQSTIRNIDSGALALLKASKSHAPFAEAAEYLLGRTNQWRFLKRSEAYGRLEMLSTPAHPTGVRPSSGAATSKTPQSPQGSRDPALTELAVPEDGHTPLNEYRVPHWEADTFANQCAGCHCTGFDSRSKTFSVISVGCFSCHGEVELEHTKDTSKVLLAQKRQDPARVVMSICGSCHVRTGRSRSTGLTFPNNFVPGDNLLRDFAVDFSGAALAKLNPRDRHILQNVRDVVVRGKEEQTCLSCHTVHGRSSSRHRRLPRNELCWSCHEGDNLVPDWSHVSSATCGY